MGSNPTEVKFSLTRGDSQISFQRGIPKGDLVYRQYCLLPAPKHILKNYNCLFPGCYAVPLLYNYSNRVELVHEYRCAGLGSCSFFKANSIWFNEICSKDLSNRPIYAVLNTHSLYMILQLKHMLIVTEWIRLESPRFFYVFNLLIWSFSTCSQSFKKICTREILGANVHKSFIGGVASKVHNNISRDTMLQFVWHAVCQF